MDGEAAGSLGDASGPTVTLTATERANVGLRTEVAELRPLEDIRRMPAVIKALPDRVAVVTSQTVGHVVGIHARLGQRVNKGEDLIDIHSLEVERLELALLQAESRARSEILKLETDLLQAQNKLRVTQAEADRHRLLVEKGIGARKELLTAENQLQAVENEIGGLRRQIDLVELAARNEVGGLTRQLALLGLPPSEIERARRAGIVSILHVRAPIGGVVVERPVVLGQVVDGTTLLMKLVDDTAWLAEGSASEDLLGQLRVGQRVRVTVQAYPDKQFEGTLALIHPQVDPERRAVRVWAEVPDPGGQLKEELFAQLSVVVGGGAATLVVPAAALMRAEGREFVFVETPAGFRRADVLVGARSDRYVEIRQGVSPGAKVVTDGKRQLYAMFLAARSGAPGLSGHGHTH
jgi:multidrug efflux pump subunit AcrA (membrane-fusion protein)